MFRTFSFFLTIALLSTIFTACTSAPTSTPTAEALPNPASVYCAENGGTLDIRTDSQGNQAGICVFSDGSECDEWAYYRGECKPGDSLVTPADTAPATTTETVPTETAPAPTAELAPSATTETAYADWLTYQDETAGFSFSYPADATIAANTNGTAGVTLTGPFDGNEYWPMIYVNYQSDPVPPEGADLGQWLADHTLIIPEERQADVQIAGTTAVHTRFNRSPQSYAFDKYLFVHAGKLFTIVILHAADKEDWDLYNHFLESFKF